MPSGSIELLSGLIQFHKYFNSKVSDWSIVSNPSLPSPELGSTKLRLIV